MFARLFAALDRRFNLGWRQNAPGRRSIYTNWKQVDRGKTYDVPAGGGKRERERRLRQMAKNQPNAS